MYVLQRDIDDFIAHGADLVLKKPVDLGLLKTILTNVLCIRGNTDNFQK